MQRRERVSWNDSDPIPDETFRRLHPSVIEGRDEIRAFLETLRRRRVPLHRGTNRRVDRERAFIRSMDANSLVLRTENFELGGRPEVFLTAKVDGMPYFFAAPREGQARGDRLRIALPAVIYRAERRDRARTPSSSGGQRVRVTGTDGTTTEGLLQDRSRDGLALHFSEPKAPPIGSRVQVRLVDGADAGEALHGFIRNQSPVPGAPGWTRIGVALTPEQAGELLGVEQWGALSPAIRLGGARVSWKIASAGARSASSRIWRRVARRSPALPKVRTLDYANEAGENIRAILDAAGATCGAPAVVIPPAWGRTKETLLPLAAVIVETFRRAGERVCVIRFDGIRKRGESYNEPDARVAGRENLEFTFSQGLCDIRTTLDFLYRSSEFRPSRTVLISFSGASIDARRAVATESGGRLAGWVCVVGSADLQSMIRVISGGLDYLGGVERGVRFGVQDILGLVVDVDKSSRDAIDAELAFLDDARRDFATIRIPVTWIHGRYDAWMNLGRVRDAMSFGDTSNRRLIQIPTGHQLKTSVEALEVFQLIAREVSRMVLGRELEPALPDLLELDRLREAERRRRPTPDLDVRAFWRDYLLGREGRFGMELLTCTSAYRALMDEQVKALDLKPGNRLADFGSGTGALLVELTDRSETLAPLEIHEIDYVMEALVDARRRRGPKLERGGVITRYIACDLDPAKGRSAVPIRSNTYDAVLASLLLNYVSKPEAMLREAHRLLRPGGRLVVSSLRRDADISKICVEGAAELRSGLGRAIFGADGERLLNESIRGFMSDAARILDLEELGLFRFFDLEEVVALVRNSGFTIADTRMAFGDPRQAVVVSALRL